jgi:hypothetical protein
MPALTEGVRSIGLFLEDLWREWGLQGLGILVAAAIVWKLITRVK